MQEFTVYENDRKATENKGTEKEENTHRREQQAVRGK